MPVMTVDTSFFPPKMISTVFLTSAMAGSCASTCGTHKTFPTVRSRCASKTLAETGPASFRTGSALWRVRGRGRRGLLNLARGRLFSRHLALARQFHDLVRERVELDREALTEPHRQVESAGRVDAAQGQVLQTLCDVIGHGIADPEELFHRERISPSPPVT